jgi:hypothetical protein
LFNILAIPAAATYSFVPICPIKYVLITPIRLPETSEMIYGTVIVKISLKAWEMNFGSLYV